VENRKKGLSLLCEEGAEVVLKVAGRGAGIFWWSLFSVSYAMRKEKY